MPTTRSRTKDDPSSPIKKGTARAKLRAKRDTDHEEDIPSTPRTRSMTRSQASQQKPTTGNVTRGRKLKETSETAKSEGEDAIANSPGDPRSPSSSRSPTQRRKVNKVKSQKIGSFIGVEITGKPFFNPNVNALVPQKKKDEIAKEDDWVQVPRAFNKTIFSHNIIATFLSIPILFCLLACIFEHSRCQKALQDTFITSLCSIPGVSTKPVCNPKPPSAWADFPGLMDLQTKNFENLAREWIGGSTSLLEMKATEIAMKDLVTLVKTSELGAKLALASSLKNLAAETKWAGRALQKLDSKIKGAVDSAVAMNEYALRGIEGVMVQGDNSIGWSILGKQDPKTVMLRMFERSMDRLSNAATKLINEAENSLRSLSRLEERLNTVYEVALEENLPVSSAAGDHLLGELWTILARNKVWRDSDEDRLIILRGFKEMKEGVITRTIGVSNALFTMNKMLDELRERTVILNPEGADSFDAHMQSLKKGIERMRFIQNAAKMSEEVGLKDVLSRYGIGVGEA